MPSSYETLHQYIQQDLNTSNAQPDRDLLDAFENFAHLSEGPADPTTPRATRGGMNSDGSPGDVLNVSPYNILRLNFTEIVSLVAGTVKDTGILLIDGGDFNLTKAGIALAGLINRFQTAATEKLETPDAKVIFAIARVDQRQCTKTDIKAAYQTLFQEELSDNYLDESIAKLSGLKILIETGASVRLKEELEITF